MKAQILKIAKVKSEKEFYKKYPSEEAFMKVHGKAFKKAQFGTYIGGDTNATPAMVDYSTTGISDKFFLNLSRDHNYDTAKVTLMPLHQNHSEQLDIL